jgi:nucleotide-binding universal stress UspA family protein
MSKVLGMSAERGVQRPVVVVGFDGSPAAERALDRIGALFGRSLGRLIVVHAIHSISSSGALSQPVLEAPGAVERNEVLERARGLAAAQDMDAEVLEREGEPAEVLVRVAAEESADLLVVGRTGRDYVARALLGSTAENVIRAASCDVLVV